MNRCRELLFLKEINGVGSARINKFYAPLLSGNITLDELVAVVKENETKTDDNDIEEALETSQKYVELYGHRDDYRIITILDKEYPSKLKSLKNNAPVILYVKGDISISEKPSISVIGTRNPSDWSVKVGRQLVGKILELSGRIIVSGLAVGCDTVAHRTCIDNSGKTIAMLPCGFDHILPEDNEGLCDDILRTGGLLISEYPPDAEATQYTFVERDDLIAAISDAVFVVECGVGSGTMHTVKTGFKIDRKIAAFSTEAKEKGNYEGNDYIISDLKGTAVPDTEALKSFLDSIESAGEAQPYQTSLFDTPGN